VNTDYYVDPYIYTTATRPEREAIDEWLDAHDFDHLLVKEISRDVEHGHIIVSHMNRRDDGRIMHIAGEVILSYSAMHDDDTFPWPAHVLTSG
jgi:hypothetical protein